MTVRISRGWQAQSAAAGALGVMRDGASACSCERRLYRPRTHHRRLWHSKLGRQLGNELAGDLHIVAGLQAGLRERHDAQRYVLNK